MDIGRDQVKAVVILVIPGSTEPQVVGYGLAPTGGHDITGGRLEADATLQPVDAALTQAEDSAEKYIGQKIVPDDVIFALGGRATVGALFTVRQERPHPTEGISAKELAALQNRAERLVRQGLVNLPIEGGQWQALAVTDAGFYLDERLVLGAQGLMGRDITYSVFGVAGHSGGLRALTTLANRLDLLVANVVAAPQALAAITPAPEAIILDIGYGSTDICIIRNNALVAADSVPLGGHFFTMAISRQFDMEPAEAKDLKHAMRAGDLSRAEVGWLTAYLQSARERWYEAVLEALQRMSRKVNAQNNIFDRPLPRQIFLTGGGSLMPGLDAMFRADPGSFSRPPEVTQLGRGALTAVQDLTDGLDDNLFLLTLSLTVGLPD